MLFRETSLGGAFVIELEKREDERGFFARSYCRQEFEEHGLDPNITQCNVSFNRHAGTLRGMHFQRSPHEEAKLVRCTAGAIYDVIIDLRPDSPTFQQHFGVELTSRNRRALFVPKGFAHGFQTLADETEVFYQMSDVYFPEAAAGVRWNDPAFGIEWPRPAALMSAQDRAYPDFQGFGDSRLLPVVAEVP